MTKYYYVDLCDSDGDCEIEEYANEDEFYDGMLWNRDIAEEYGDDVPKEKDVLRDFETHDNWQDSFNGAIFIKTNKSLKDFGY